MAFLNSKIKENESGTVKKSKRIFNNIYKE